MSVDPLSFGHAGTGSLKDPPWESSMPYMLGTKKLPLAGWCLLGSRLVLFIDRRLMPLPKGLRKAAGVLEAAARWSRCPVPLAHFLVVGGLVAALLLWPGSFAKKSSA